MAPRQDRIIQNDFRVGMIRDVARHLIPSNGVYELTDYLMDEDGMPYKRGGTVAKSNTNFGTSLRFVWDGFFDAGQRTLMANPNDFGVLGGDDETPVNLGSDGLSSPKVAALVAGMLFIGGGYIYGGSRKTGTYTVGTIATTAGSRVITGTGTSFLANVDAGMLLQIGNERVYVIASVDSNTQLTIREEFDGSGNVIGYEGSTAAGKSYVLNNLYKINAASPYKISDFYAVITGRLIVASNNLVEVSEINKPHDWTATIGDKQIPTTHELPEGVFVLGLGVQGQTLLVFTTGGTWTITGLPFDIVDVDGNPQQQLAVLSRDFVALNSEGVASWNQSLIVPTADGVYLLDGVSAPVKLSRSIERMYREYVRLGYRAGQAVEYQGHYFLPIITTGGVAKDVLVCRLDRPVTVRNETMYPWTHLSGQAGEIVAFAQRIGQTSRSPVLLGADSRTSARVLDCQRFFAPGGPFKQDQDGTTFASDLVTRDIETGDMTENMVRWVRINQQLIDAGTDDPFLDLSYASDLADPDGPYWGADDGEWGTGFGPAKAGALQPWTDSVESQFKSLCRIPEDFDGTHPTRCRVNTRARYIRFRLRSKKPCAVHRMRAIEVAIRPSRAVRR